VVDLATVVVPGSVGGQRPLDVLDQAPHLPAGVVACHLLVVQVGKDPAPSDALVGSSGAETPVQNADVRPGVSQRQRRRTQPQAEGTFVKQSPQAADAGRGGVVRVWSRPGSPRRRPCWMHRRRPRPYRARRTVTWQVGGRALPDQQQGIELQPASERARPGARADGLARRTPVRTNTANLVPAVPPPFVRILTWNDLENGQDAPRLTFIAVMISSGSGLEISFTPSFVTT
jgi:hypothetical protein